ncbi:MAG: SDR family oxidoreductase [Elusimicrobia bacterium]|nr:SDR family oxidoreductase [Elusimicrobiota bacterium]
MSTHTVLITGGFGYVGSRLTPHLLEQGHRVRVIDLFLYGDAGLKALQAMPGSADRRSRLETIRADIRDPRAVEGAVQGADTVIHLAAISNDPTGQVDETLTKQVNFDAVGLLLSLARARGVRRFINASSSSVFGIKKEADVTEDLEPEPLTFYSKYKMLAEWLVVAAHAPDFTTVNVRPATICGYSPRQRFDLTVNKLTADAVRKRVITVYGGQQRRPNVGMTDMINLYGGLLDAPAESINGRTFNFGFENLKVIEIAQAVQNELADLKPAIQTSAGTDQRDYHISSAKISRTLGYRPVSSIRREVRELRARLETAEFADIDADRYYNMKTMKMERSRKAYDFLAR